jgi:hypothetical protein
MTYNEFSYHIENEDKKAQGCICLKCTSCDWQIFWYEGNLERLYTKYKEGCPKCNGKINVYGSNEGGL